MSLIGSQAFRNPAFTPEQARDLARDVWGVHGEATDVGSLQDQNFRIDASDGRTLTLRIANASKAREALELEHAALRHLAVRIEDLAVPLPVATRDGGEMIRTRGHDVRMLTWVPGALLAREPHLDDEACRTLGAVAACCGAALVGFAHPAARRSSPWDPRHAVAVVAALADELTAAQHASLADALEPLRASVLPVAERLPRQVLHSDVTDVNVVGRFGRDGRFVATGLLDFGDLVETWRVCDPAATAVAAIGRRPEDALGVALAVLAGYQASSPLEENEVDAFWPVVLARAALCVAMSAPQTAHSPGNEYAAETHRADWRALDAATAVAPELAIAAARVVCGLEPAPAMAGVPARVAAAAPVPIVAGEMVPIDLSVASERLVDGNWEDADRLREALAVDGVAVGRWGEERLPHAGRASRRPPDTLHLGADVFVAAGTPVRAPLPGHVAVAYEGTIVLACPLDGQDVYVRLAGVSASVAAGSTVGLGERVGEVAPDSGPLPAHVHIQLCSRPDAPGLGRARERAAWLALCPDPSALVGVPVAAAEPVDAAVARASRERVVANPQGLYYQAPMQMVRGWRQHLYDRSGRPFLDMVNNVAVVGHSHPRVTAAAHRQLRLLNTNSRFLYDSLTEYAARISALLPGPLDTVFVVNSGSEAVDLAIQLARVFTGRRDLAAVAGAYHGWTAAAFETCSHPQDNPTWQATKPPYVHVTEQPDPYRGAHGGDAARYAESVRAACAAAEANGGIAGFLSEALLGAQGGIVPPPGYLAQAFAAVREAGGLCIADEVQVGYGRTGSDFWAFAHEGVVPDIVAAAKATGNGHPVGVVACRREIADALGRRASFFSSTGGGPVSCRIGLAVLDVIRDERLQENAATVGMHLRRGLAELGDRYDEVGAVHGRGLYVGVDLVRDRATKEPAPEEAMAICERLRELGVIVQPTGDAFNVLKVKPPLCLGIDDADYFVAALGQALAERSHARESS